jgi:hypothetical protein
MTMKIDRTRAEGAKRGYDDPDRKTSGGGGI